MNSILNPGAFIRRFARAFDLWYRLGFSAKLAWRRAGEWQ